ncbi:MAG TPA: dihydrodipicolinate synthetase [Algoriphagus sp.]|nr:dihydrodipicolinate synthetase [Algoriphagus sp.]
MQFQKITGLMAATFTPFTPSGKLNLDIITLYAKTLRESEISGVFINGTTGENASLTHQEQIDLIRAWAPFNDTNFKVVAMVSGTNQEQGKELAALCHQLNIFGIAANAPFYTKPQSISQLLNFLSPIAAVAPDLPFYFYHIPQLTQVNLSMIELLKNAHAFIPSFAGIKYTHTNLMEFNQCTRFAKGRYDILWGWDEMLLAGLAMGAKGGVGSTYNFAAPLYKKIIKEFQTGNLTTAKILQEQSIDIIAHYPKFGGAAAGKILMKHIGLDFGDFRSPIPKIPKDQKNKLIQTLSEKGLLTNFIQSEENQINP